MSYHGTAMDCNQRSRLFSSHIHRLEEISSLGVTISWLRHCFINSFGFSKHAWPCAIAALQSGEAGLNAANRSATNNLTIRGRCIQYCSSSRITGSQRSEADDSQGHDWTVMGRPPPPVRSKVSRRPLSTNRLASCPWPLPSDLTGCWVDVVLAEAVSSDPPRDVCSALHCSAFLRPISSQTSFSTHNQGSY
jgi:hypothetical protein